MFHQYLIEKAGLTEEEYQNLQGFLQVRKLKKGTFLLREGEICEDSFFVEKGVLRYYSIDSQGKEHIIQFATENWFMVDRGSAFFQQASGYFIDAIEDTEVIVLSKAFIQFANQNTRNFAEYNQQLLHLHIMHLQNRIRLLIGANAEERYLDFVRLYPDLLGRVPQWMVASYLGITPESLSRVRKELTKKEC